MAAYIREQAGIETRLDSRGRVGELTVWVGDQLVTRKGLFKFPKKEDVLAAVHQALEGAKLTPVSANL